MERKEKLGKKSHKVLTKHAPDLDPVYDIPVMNAMAEFSKIQRDRLIRDLVVFIKKWKALH